MGSNFRPSSPTSVISSWASSNRFAALAFDMDDDEEDDGSVFEDTAGKPLTVNAGDATDVQGLSPSASNLVRGVTAGVSCGVSPS